MADAENPPRPLTGPAQSGRRWWIFVSGAAFVVLGIAIWLAAHDAADASAIQAVSSYTLVVVTAAYVLLTHNLVENQRRQARYELEMRAVMELARLLHQARRFMIPSLRDLFPYSGRGEKPDSDRLARPDAQLLDLYWDLNRLTPELPSDLRAEADRAWHAVWQASSDTVNILWAFKCEEQAAEKEGRPWTWDGAARFYREDHEVGREGDPGYWSEMIRGVRVSTAINALDALDRTVDQVRSR